MIKLENGNKPSQITQPGTYVVVSANIGADPSKNISVVDVWIDAKGGCRVLNGNSLPEITKHWNDNYTFYGPVELPAPPAPPEQPEWDSRRERSA